MTSVFVNLGGDVAAQVDQDDAERVLQHKWLVSRPRTGSIYALTRINRRTVYLHRFVMNAPSGFDVDHIDMNGMNCQKANLRIATRGQNMANSGPKSSNTSGFKGVSWNKRLGKWHATITVNRKRRHLGFFGLAEDAAMAYDTAAFEAFGEFAYLNGGKSQ